MKLPKLQPKIEPKIVKKEDKEPKKETIIPAKANKRKCNHPVACRKLNKRVIPQRGES